MDATAGAAGCEERIMMDTVIVLFNRDLRTHDHPALAAACENARQVVPLFVLDPALPTGRRSAFLSECLADLRRSLRERGGELVIRRGIRSRRPYGWQGGSRPKPFTPVWTSARSRDAGSGGWPRRVSGAGWSFAGSPA